MFNLCKGVGICAKGIENLLSQLFMIKIQLKLIEGFIFVFWKYF